MKKLSILIVITIFLAQGCKKASTDDLSNNTALKQNLDANVTNAKEKLVAFITDQHLLNKVADFNNLARNNAAQNTARQGLPRNTDREDYESFVQTAIDPNSYQCGPTILDQYINNKVSTWDANDFNIYFAFSGIVFDYAFVYQNSNASGIPYFGDHGQYTNVSTRTIRDLKNFWNIPTDIYLTSSHGVFFNDINRMTVILKLYRDLGILDPSTTDAQITGIARYLQLVFGSSHFQNFLNPLLTFNAFASDADPFFHTTKKIVMGDGIQQAYFDLGYGDVATQAIMSHEYGHQVQFANPALVTFEFTPEGTRLTELMADAFAGYFLTHSRGASMNWHRVKEFLGVFYSIGDCQFSSASHHGTPNQRMKAAQFGNDLANNAQNQGQILTSQQFITRFLAAYPAIIAPDGQ